MVEFNIAYDGTDLSTGGSAKPFPEGTKRLVRILPSRKDGTTVEVRPFSSRQGSPNASIMALHLRVEVVEGQAGAKRQLFASGNGVPLARQVYSERKGGPVPAYDFAGFMNAVGVDVNSPDGIKIDDNFLRSLGGKQLEVVIGLEKDRDGNDRNFIRFYNPANGLVTTPDPEPRAQAVATHVVAAAPGGAPAWLASPSAPAQAAPGSAAPGMAPGLQNAVANAAAQGGY